MATKQSTTSTVDTVIHSQRQIFEAAEQILRNENDGMTLGADEYAVLQAAGLSDKYDHRKAMARVSRVSRWQDQAKTQKDRDAISKQVAEAEKVRQEKLPALRKELDELTQRLEVEIRNLNEAVEIPAKKLELMEEACGHLRNLSILPEHVVNEYNARKRSVKESFPELNRYKAIVKSYPEHISVLKQKNPHDRVFRTIANMNRGNFIYLDETGSEKVNWTKVMEYVARLEAELEDAQAKLDDGLPQFQEQLAEVEKIRDYYIQ